MFEFPIYEVVAVPPEPYDEHNVAKVVGGDINKQRARSLARQYATACATPVDWHWLHDRNEMLVYNGNRELMMKVVVQEKPFIRWNEIVQCMGIDPNCARTIFESMSIYSFAEFVSVFFPNNNQRTRDKMVEAFELQYYD